MTREAAKAAVIMESPSERPIHPEDSDVPRSVSGRCYLLWLRDGGRWWNPDSFSANSFLPALFAILLRFLHVFCIRLILSAVRTMMGTSGHAQREEKDEAKWLHEQLSSGHLLAGLDR